MVEPQLDLLLVLEKDLLLDRVRQVLLVLQLDRAQGQVLHDLLDRVQDLQLAQVLVLNDLRLDRARNQVLHDLLDQVQLDQRQLVLRLVQVQTLEDQVPLDHHQDLAQHVLLLDHTASLLLVDRLV